MKTLKVAIFSGGFPDTTFLTLLINELCNEKIKIHIYGKLKGKKTQHKNLFFFTYKDNRLSKLSVFVKYFIFNLLFNPLILVKVINLVGKRKNDFVAKYNQLIIVLPITYNRPDIVHIQWIKSYSIFEGLEKILDIKFIVSIRGHQLIVSPLVNQKFNEIIKNALVKADLIHSISDYLTNIAIRINPASENKIIKILPSVDLQFFKSESLEKNNKNKMLKIVSVCRLSWVKGLNYGLETMKLLHEKGYAFKYYIVGEGEKRNELEFLIKQYNLTDTVFICGSMNHERLRDFMNDADVFFMPSVVEGYCNAVIEAQAMSIPCIVSNVGGLKENIHDGINGFLFESRDSVSACECFEKIIQLDDNEFSKMKLNSRLKCLNFHDVKVQTKKFYEMYSSFYISKILNNDNSTM